VDASAVPALTVVPVRFPLLCWVLLAAAAAGFVRSVPVALTPAHAPTRRKHLAVPALRVGRGGPAAFRPISPTPALRTRHRPAPGPRQRRATPFYGRAGSTSAPLAGCLTKRMPPVGNWPTVPLPARLLSRDISPPCAPPCSRSRNFDLVPRRLLRAGAAGRFPSRGRLVGYLPCRPQPRVPWTRRVPARNTSQCGGRHAGRG